MDEIEHNLLIKLDEFNSLFFDLDDKKIEIMKLLHLKDKVRLIAYDISSDERWALAEGKINYTDNFYFWKVNETIFNIQKVRNIYKNNFDIDCIELYHEPRK